MQACTLVYEGYHSCNQLATLRCMPHSMLHAAKTNRLDTLSVAITAHHGTVPMQHSGYQMPFIKHWLHRVKTDLCQPVCVCSMMVLAVRIQRTSFYVAVTMPQAACLGQTMPCSPFSTRGDSHRAVPWEARHTPPFVKGFDTARERQAKHSCARHSSARRAEQVGCQLAASWLSKWWPPP